MQTIRLFHDAQTYEEIQVPTVYCIGLNYAKHAEEMRSQRPQEPVVFLKPSSSLVPGGGELIYPSFSQDLHHEVEVVVLISQAAHQIDLEHASQYIAGYGIGLDLTLRDLQSQAKAKGQPWAVAKGFKGSAPISDFYSPALLGGKENYNFSLQVNDQLKQQGNTQDMLFSIPELISYLSTIFQLSRGDLIFTGTPEGVGPLLPGDRAKANLEQQLFLEITIGQ